jgi:hypothetical protein
MLEIAVEHTRNFIPNLECKNKVLRFGMATDITVLWHMTPCSLIDLHRLLEEPASGKIEAIGSFEILVTIY